jgi:hypothetical protein
LTSDHHVAPLEHDLLSLELTEGALTLFVDGRPIAFALLASR